MPSRLQTTLKRRLRLVAVPDDLGAVSALGAGEHAAARGMTADVVERIPGRGRANIDQVLAHRAGVPSVNVF